MIAIRSVGRSLKRFVQPNAVLPVRIGQRAIPDDVVASVNTFLLLFLVMFAAGGLMLSAMGLDVVTSFSASAACLGNVGPAFGLAGPAQTYAPFPAVAKVMLMVQMLFGRLELYTILVLFFFSHRGLGR
jgi:trk system potassium uptake protein TrkH